MPQNASGDVIVRAFQKTIAEKSNVKVKTGSATLRSAIEKLNNLLTFDADFSVV